MAKTKNNRRRIVHDQKRQPKHKGKAKPEATYLVSEEEVARIMDRLARGV